MRVSAQHRRHSGIDNKRDVHFVPQMHHILMRIAISANNVQREVLGIKSQGFVNVLIVLDLCYWELCLMPSEIRVYLFFHLTLSSRLRLSQSKEETKMWPYVLHRNLCGMIKVKLVSIVLLPIQTGIKKQQNVFHVEMDKCGMTKHNTVNNHLNCRYCLVVLKTPFIL